MAEDTALLPDDVLADILTRLAPRDLAMAMGVCRAWRAVIDGRRLLRADLLPLSLGGMFINFNSHSFSEYFFQTSSTTPTISSITDYVPYAKKDHWRYVEGHCNGLLLLYGDYVVNPATQWWMQVPPSLHTSPRTFRYNDYLVFDPTLSSHFEVFSIPHFYKDGPDGLMEDSEWPLSSCILHVFSSRTHAWEERLFVRDGEVTVTVSSMRKGFVRNSAIYYRRALYVHCQTNIVLRISLSANKYRAIKPPTADKIVFNIAKSKDGVYFASFGSTWGDNVLRIWVLNESYGQAEWFLKYHVDFKCVTQEISYLSPSGSWVLQDVNYNYHRDSFPKEKNKRKKHGGDRAKEHNYRGPVDILGFHPFEEVLFLSQSLRRGLAYHLNTSKVEDLGCLYPTRYDYFAQACEIILEYFPYTPCWM